jgi:putative PIN family toxin of toxin-antitoxin system
MSQVPRIVVDTNVLTGALLRKEGYNRRVLRACLEDRAKPVVGQTLFLEYEDVLGREALFRKSPLSALERQELFEAFLSVCDWVQIYYLWRPNLRDEGDNHVLELAVAGGVAAIVTNNIADFRFSDLRFPDLRILTPRAFDRELV